MSSLLIYSIFAPVFTLLLQVKYADDPVNCSFEGMTYRENSSGKGGGPEQSIVLAVHNNKVVLKSTGEVWVPPEKGFMRFNFQQAVTVPTIADAIDDKSHDLLMKIVEAGKESDKKKDVDKKRIWLHLLCQDVYFTTEQVRLVWFSCFLFVLERRCRYIPADLTQNKN